MMPPFNNIPNTFTAATPSINLPSISTPQIKSPTLTVPNLGNFTYIPPVPTFQFRVPSIQPRFSVALPRVSDYIHLPIRLQLPNLPTLICYTATNFNFHNIHDFFQTLGTYPGQIQAQIANIPKLLNQDLTRLSLAIKAALNNATTQFTNTLHRIKDLEHEMAYKAREFAKNVENFFSNFTLQNLGALLEKLGLDIERLLLSIPIPYLSGCVIGDMFTVSGRNKIKNAIVVLAERKLLADIIHFLSAFDGTLAFAFNGRLGDAIIEFQIEEVWHRLITWVMSQVNYFMQFVFAPAMNAALNGAWSTAATLATAAAVTNPTLAPLAGYCTAQIGIVEAAFLPLLVDPTVVIKQALIGVFESALANATKNPIKQMNHVISEILNFPIPFPLDVLVGASTVGGIIGVDLQDEIFKYKIGKVEITLMKVWDLFTQALERLKRLFVSTFNIVIYGSFTTELIKAFGEDLARTFLDFIISNVPILSTIYEVFTILIDIFTGNFSSCIAMTALAPELFALVPLIKTILTSSNSVKFNFSPHGFLSKEKNALINALKHSVSGGITIVQT